MGPFGRFPQQIGTPGFGLGFEVFSLIWMGTRGRYHGLACGDYGHDSLDARFKRSRGARSGCKIWGCIGCYPGPLNVRYMGNFSHELRGPFGCGLPRGTGKGRGTSGRVIHSILSGLFVNYLGLGGYS